MTLPFASGGGDAAAAPHSASAAAAALGPHLVGSVAGIWIVASSHLLLTVAAAAVPFAVVDRGVARCDADILAASAFLGILPSATSAGAVLGFVSVSVPCTVFVAGQRYFVVGQDLNPVVVLLEFP